MFTGIITDVGELIRMEKRGDTRFSIATRYAPESIAIGASIACSGCCLTVVEVSRHRDGRTVFDVQASAETLSKTTLQNWREGVKVNLEGALRMGDELGGHIVSGHVDGLGEIVSIAHEGGSFRFRIAAPSDIARFIAQKGSVTLDGISLTVNEVEENIFGINMIPHTRAVTTWGHAGVGDAVNIEIDMLARYVARLAEFRTS